MLKKILSVLTLCASGLCQAQSFSHELGTVELAQTPTRIVTLEWSLAEIALDLDVTPIAMAEVDGYRQWVVEPALPQNVADLGSRREPNLERLQALKPDLILVPNDYAPMLDKLQKIAPVMVLSIYTEQRNPWQRAREVTEIMASVLGKQTQANALLAHVDAQFAIYRSQLSGITAPIALVNITDPRHVRVYGGQGLYQATLDKLGLSNAWQGETNYWGFATSGIEQLNVKPGASLFYFQPVPEQTLATLNQSPLWRARDFVREQRVHSLEPVWAFGALHAAERLAGQLSRALTGE